MLESLATPQTILQAVNEHEVGACHVPPQRLADVVVLANRAAKALELVASGRTAERIEPALGRLLQESEGEIRSLLAALRN